MMLPVAQIQEKWRWSGDMERRIWLKQFPRTTDPCPEPFGLFESEHLLVGVLERKVERLCGEVPNDVCAVASPD